MFAVWWLSEIQEEEWINFLVISTPKKPVRATPQQMVPLFCRENHPPGPTS
jgi:hypothetical protein